MSSVLKELLKIIFTEAQMNRYRRSAPTSGKRLHRHCESCHSKYCKAPIEITLSCMIINCRLLCGASFHMCKEDEHILLCPNERVPCINADYGCPFTMCRSKLAKHLEVCPASVVVCSMEWNRWPVEDIKSPFFSNLMKDIHKHQTLDMSTALRDQKQLCSRLKMRSFFPQLMQEPEEPIPTEAELTGDDFLVDESHVNCMGSEVSINGPVNVDTKETAAKDLTVNKEKYKIYENMFSKERGGCKQAQEEELKKEVQKDRSEQTKGVHNSSTPDQQGAKSGTVDDKHEGDVVRPDIYKTGLAPWQEGVLERLGQEVSPKEFNMYVVHHGRMLLTFGQIKACTPREKDFVYGSLEPIPVQSLRSFNVPISYRQKRIQPKDSATRVHTEHKSVDTSDLSSIEGTEKMDEMFATLLCAAEVEIRGHKISETVATDGLYIDIANQTYDFPAAPFGYKTTLADITEDRDMKLYLQIDTECVTLRHNKTTSAFTFMCEHLFRRDEFASHFKNVHSDIQSCLNGWFEERCPLAYLGCTFSQRRLQPSTHRATVFFNQDLSTFTLRPDIATPLVADSQMDPLGYENSLSDLPFEVLRQIARYLDSFSLSQLALVSRLFRDVSATILHDRGMVSLIWRKKLYAHGISKWKPSIVWEFSSLFSRVDTWCIGDTPSMAEHLKHCPFYQKEPKTKPFPLARIRKNNNGLKAPKGLVTQLMGQS